MLNLIQKIYIVCTTNAAYLEIHKKCRYFNSNQLCFVSNHVAIPPSKSLSPFFLIIVNSFQNTYFTYG